MEALSKAKAKIPCEYPPGFFKPVELDELIYRNLFGSGYRVVVMGNWFSSGKKDAAAKPAISEEKIVESSSGIHLLEIHIPTMGLSIIWIALVFTLAGLAAWGALRLRRKCKEMWSRRGRDEKDNIELRSYGRVDLPTLRFDDWQSQFGTRRPAPWWKGLAPQIGRAHV